MLIKTLNEQFKEQITEWANYTGMPQVDHLIDMINSEFEELIYAIRQNDEVEQFDAIIDIIYLSLQLYVHTRDHHNAAVNVEGTLKSLVKMNNSGEFCYSEEDILLGLEAVHASNMSKFCKTEEEAIETVDRYVVGGRVVTYEKVNDLYVVKDDQGKVRKAVNYKPPTDDLRKILIDTGVIDNDVS